MDIDQTPNMLQLHCLHPCALYFRPEHALLALQASERNAHNQGQMIGRSQIKQCDVPLGQLQEDLLKLCLELLHMYQHGNHRLCEVAPVVKARKWHQIVYMTSVS